MRRQVKPLKTAPIRYQSQSNRLVFERLERRELLAAAPPSSELTEGNAAEWEAFADGATATVTNNSVFVKQGGQSLKLDTLGGLDTGIRYRAPAPNWDFSQIDVVTFWVYGNNTTPYAWQGNQPNIKFLSPGGSLTLTPSQQMMPNFSWAQLTIPLAGDGIWQRETQGSFDIGNVTTFEIHQDTWDYGFISYYDGLRFAKYSDLPDLVEPKGLDVDSQSRTYVVESAAGRVRVFDAYGQVSHAIGSLGSGDGEFISPTDASIGPGDKLYVSDTGNHRIQVFDTSGTYLMKFGTSGSAIGAFSNPAGIAVDGSSGKVYVADAGNHRVQRFLPSGAIDSSWGVGGVVGSTGTVKRDNAGFDSPSDVAIHPNGEIFIADRGNQRIQVYTASGQYLRTHLGVFQPRSLSFDSIGNLYIAGDDPNNNYHAFDGRLRVLRQGDELIGRHFTGGLDDLGRKLNGVVVRPDGRIVISDTINGRLVQVDAGLNLPLSNVAVRASGSYLVVTWDSLRPGPSRVAVNGQVYTNPVSTRNHAVRIEGLTPNTQVGYSLAFSDTFTGQERWTPEDYVNTGVPAGQTDFLRVKAVGLVYTDGNNGAGYTRLPQVEIDLMRNRFDTVAAYYWRNSGLKLWLDFTVREVNLDLANGVNLFSRMNDDLSSQGFSAADDIDAVYSVWPWAVGNFGGSSSVFGRSVAAAIWATQTDFVAIHEVNHSIDSLYGMSGLRKYEFNHGIWAVPNGLGHDFAINAQVLRNMLAANYTATLTPFSKRMSAADADGDGFPDVSPAGLTKPLAITEATFGSSPDNTDTDGDGWSDLAEATALTNTATNGNLADSDSDGLRDSVDPNPLYRIANLIRKGTPLIDGSIGVTEGWTTLTQNWGFTNTSLVSDSNQLQSQVTTFAAWDDNYLYFALLGPASQTQLRIDGDADNWFMGTSNYELNLRNDSNSLSMRVNAGSPDLFRQIDNDGQYSEFFDTDPQFTRPYNGRPIFNQPAEGLGFTGRLATESQLTYQRGGSGNQQVWEVRIPWSHRSLLRGQTGKELAVDFNVGGDRLFETDHFARLRLVSQAVEPPIMNLDGSFTYIEKTAPILIAQQGSIIDYDSFDLQNGQFSVSIAAAHESDRLAIMQDGLERGQIGIVGSNILYGGRIIGTFSGGMGATPLVVTLNQNATIQTAEALLRRISYQASGSDPAPGTRIVSFVLSDGDGGVSASRTVEVAVQGVNDLPTLDALNNLEIQEDEAQQTVNLTGILAGGGESQPLKVTATSSDTGLIPNPTVTYETPNQTGFLSFRPVANQSGIATVTVTVEDGGLDGNLSTLADNATFSRVFLVTVNPVNDVPMLDLLSDLTINEDAPQQAVNLTGIFAGGGESQPLKVTATSSNTALIPNPSVTYQTPNPTGSLSFTPVVNQSGTAIITVTIEDGGLDGNLGTDGDNATFSRVFLVTVNPVNDVPMLDLLSDLTINEDAPQQAVNLTGIFAGGGESQPLKVTATSSNTALIPNPSVTYQTPNPTGSLSFTPVVNQSGTAIITVTIEDGGLDGNLSTDGDNATFSRVFRVTVNPVNDVPVLDPISDLTINEDAPQQSVNLTGIFSGGGESQPLKITATSSNTALIPNPSVTYQTPNPTGSISFTPVANQSGKATITVTVEDGGLDGNLDTAGDNATFSRNFEVTVTPTNDQPEINPLDDLTIDEDALLQTINLSGLNAGGGESQPLRVTATSSNTGLIPNPSVNYQSPNQTGSINFKPAANQSGTATITVTVEDGGLDGNLETQADNATISRDFLVTVNPVNDSPTLAFFGGDITYRENAVVTRISNKVALRDIDTAVLSSGSLRVAIESGGDSSDRLWITPASTPSGLLTVNGNQVLFNGLLIGLASGGTAGQPLVVSFNNRTSVARAQLILRNVCFAHDSEMPSATPRTVSVQVNDGAGGQVSATKRILVTPVNDRPMLSGIPASSTYTLNGPAIRIAPAAVITDPDSPDFAGGQLGVRFTSTADSSNRLIFGGGFSVDANNNVLRNGVIIGRRNPLGGIGATDLLITFNSNATGAIAQELLRVLSFRTVNSTSKESRTIEFSLTDGDGGSSNIVQSRIDVV